MTATNVKNAKDCALILSKARAEAVYGAMCALNNLGNAFGDIEINGSSAQCCSIRVQWMDGVTVRLGALTGPREKYASQADFAAAYDL